MTWGISKGRWGTPGAWGGYAYGITEYYFRLINARDVVSGNDNTDTSAGQIQYLTDSDEVITVGAGVPLWIDGKLVNYGGPWSNYAENPTSPATQTPGALPTGKHTLWIREGSGAGSVAISANTATITGAGSATEGNPVTIDVTVGGTVDLTVTGDVDVFQLHTGGYSIEPLFKDSVGSVASRAGTQSVYYGQPDGDTLITGFNNRTDSNKYETFNTTVNSMSCVNTVDFGVAGFEITGSIGDTVEINYEIDNYVGPAILRLQERDVVSSSVKAIIQVISSDGLFKNRYTLTENNPIFTIGTATADNTSFEAINISVQKIPKVGLSEAFPKLYGALTGFDGADAAARITGEFEIGVAAADLPDGSYNLLYTDGTVTPFSLFKSGATRELRFTDGTNTAAATLDWLADTIYEFKPVYGTNIAADALKMQVSVRVKGAASWTDSSLTDYTGNIPITGDKMVFCEGNDELTKIGNLIFEPVSNAEGWK